MTSKSSPVHTHTHGYVTFPFVKTEFRSYSNRRKFLLRNVSLTQYICRVLYMLRRIQVIAHCHQLLVVTKHHNFWPVTHTQMVKTPLKTRRDETSQKTTTSHLLQKQTFNYGSSAALVADRRVLMCASKQRYIEPVTFLTPTKDIQRKSLQEENERQFKTNRVLTSKCLESDHLTCHFK